MKFTILTPTYNRAYTLKRLYESLKRQTFQDFEWLVIDDGSIDNTKTLIESFISEKPFFEIVYKYKENGGKHRAINYGVSFARGEMTFLLDSDDWLTDDSLLITDQVEKSISQEDKEKIIGVSGLKVFENNKNIGNTFTGEYIDTIYMKKGKFGISGDKGEVFYTELLKKYPFPEFDGEKFATERLVWNKMSFDGYKIRYFNKPVQYCEYLPDGLTAGGYSMYAKYPKQWGLAIWQDYNYGEKGVKGWYHNTLQVYVFYLYMNKTLKWKEMAKCLNTTPCNLKFMVTLQKFVDFIRGIVNRGKTMKRSAIEEMNKHK